jgi:hypothetical protein
MAAMMKPRDAAYKPDSPASPGDAVAVDAGSRIRFPSV